MADVKASDTHTHADNKWSVHAGNYSSQLARVTELHGADLVTILKDDILKAKTILELGCGTGAFAKAYLQQFPNGVPGQTIIMSDLSAGMLEKAKETVKPGSGFQTEIKFEEEDATKLEGVAECSIDLVVSMFCILLIPDQEGVQKAIQRVLKKPNGVVAIASWLFGLSDLLVAQGFGVSVQDAFFVPVLTIDPKWNLVDNAWATQSGGSKKLSDDYGMKRVETFGALHSVTMDFETLWSMLSKSPVSNIESAAEEDVKRAKAALVEFVTQGGKLSLEGPVTYSTASNLFVGRGFSVSTGQQTGQ